MMKKLLHVATLLGGVALLGGCSSEFGMDFGYLSSPPLEADIAVEFGQIRLEDGYAVAVVARPLEDQDKMDWETTLELEPSDTRIFDVERLEYDPEREERKDYDLRDGDWSFMLWGRTPGRATLDVWVDGELEAEIPVFVNPQPDVD